ncbi:MAG: hypothetical protein K5842_06695, partial [Bacteroidales bacterium]|nr:hypothetical protein [Bacteroidales bacterium]
LPRKRLCTEGRELLRKKTNAVSQHLRINIIQRKTLTTDTGFDENDNENENIERFLKRFLKNFKRSAPKSFCLLRRPATEVEQTFKL